MNFSIADIITYSRELLISADNKTRLVQRWVRITFHHILYVNLSSTHDKLCHAIWLSHASWLQVTSVSYSCWKFTVWVQKKTRLQC